MDATKQFRFEAFSGFLELDYITSVNYALSINQFKTILRFSITNGTSDEWRNVAVRFSGTNIIVQEWSVDIISAETSIDLTDTVELTVNPDKLSSVTESFMTTFGVEVSIAGQNVFNKEFPLTIMPFEQWMGTAVRPELLATFVTPNHPLIAGIVSAAEKELLEITGSSSMDEYQTNDPNRVRAQICAIYQSLRREGLSYITPPASFCESGQRVRLSSTVLNEKHGTCLDLSLLFASCMEAVGIRPLLILTKKHCLVGAWLVRDCFQKAVSDDPDFLLKGMADGINEIVAFECTCVTSANPVSFEEAVTTGMTEIRGTQDFECFIDVTQARVNGVRPIPVNVGDNGQTTLSNTGIELDMPVPSVRQLDRYDLSIYDKANLPLTKQTIWERKLLDFSLRNSLLNMRVGSRMIPLLSFSIDKMENALQSGHSFRILPFPLASAPEKGPDRLFDSTRLAELEEHAAEELNNHRLISFLNETELQKSLKYIYRASRTSLEENGASNLFMVVGVMKWLESEVSREPRLAPILLLPVEIIRSKGGTRYSLKLREEEISFNITLTELLRQQHDVDLSALNELPKDEAGVDVKKILCVVRDKIRDKKGWNVLDEMLIGMFSFSKFVMWNDLRSNSGKIAENDIVASLIDGRLKESVDDIQTDAKDIDSTSHPAEYSIPIDVDSSQLEAIIASGEGKSFILHGPPGTGKSQTITNMIANALFHGKRVLFVAEKMAALEVVQQRLSQIGLEPFCLELHSKKVTKRHFLQQMEKALEVKHRAITAGYKAASVKLLDERKNILGYVEAMHTKDSTGFSLHDVISGYTSLPESKMIGLTEDAIGHITPEILETATERLRNLDRSVFRITGNPCGHPLADLWVRDDFDAAENELKDILPKVLGECSRRQNLANEFVDVFGIKPLPYYIDQTILKRFANLLGELPMLTPELCECTANPQIFAVFAKAVESGRIAQEIRGKLAADYSMEVLQLNPRDLRQEWDGIKTKWFLPRFFSHRKFMKRMSAFRRRITDDDVENLLDTLDIHEVNNHKYLQQSRKIGKLFGKLAFDGAEDWDGILKTMNLLPEFMEIKRTLGIGDKTDMDVMALRGNGIAGEIAVTSERIAGYIGRISKCTPLPESADLQQLTEIFNRWNEGMGLYADWVHWCHEVTLLDEAGLKIAADHITATGASGKDTADALAKGFYHTKTTAMIAATPTLKYFNGIMFDETIEKYRALTQQFQQMSKQELIRTLAKNVPVLSMEAHETSEIGILKRNIRNGGRGTSIRRLIDQLPTLMPRLCPCMLMSPISVAQYVSLDSPKFDLVIFDEASQMPTSEAVGAIARGKSLVVVGDPKQMPPTSFFATSAVGEDEAHIDDMESILDDCIALSVPSKHLSWHYRSKHESLIAFSNAQYYAGRLITFPSTDDRVSKVSFRHINGVYDRGHSRSNPVEAEAVVAEVLRRLSDPELSAKSIGIVSFNKVQQDMIEDMLTEALSDKPELESVAFNEKEPIFVKNLENVQGDERDVILFSIGYGPDKTGKISMNFGPLNNAGGERRLNVAVSRARYEMIVFSSLEPEQIDLRRSASPGIVGLKNFLEYARSGNTPLPPDKNAATDDRIPAMIANELKARGHEVVLKVGRSDFKVEIAVAHPDDPQRFILGILLDGPLYYRTKTVRDREIVQPSVLHSLNWNIMRIWSLDWYQRPKQVIEKIEQAIHNIIQSGHIKSPEIEIVPQSSPLEISTKGEESTKVSCPKKTTKARKPVNRLKEPYRMAEIQWDIKLKNLDEILLYRKQLRTQLVEIIKIEAPITSGLLYKRVANIYGIGRVTQKLQTIVDTSLSRAPIYSKENNGNGRVYWTDIDQTKNYRSYRGESERDFADIPFVEVMNAMHYVASQQLSIERDDLKRLTAAEFGNSRISASINQITEDAVSRHIKCGTIKPEGSRIIYID